MTIRKSIIALSLPLLFSSGAFAHSEHDKARFVSEMGNNDGRCDNPVRPCKTIEYAVSQANKGDHIRVADGKYRITSADEVFFLTSNIVPVKGGYNRFDHFRNQSPDINRTKLVGVPASYAEQLSLRGFDVISDGISQNINKELAAQYALIGRSQSAEACVDGMADGFPCQNMDLYSHIALPDISSSPSSASDIWGHVDLNTGNEYAIMGLYNGTVVVDISDLESPVEVGVVPGTGTSWRDVKVYQYYDDALSTWLAYAYVTSEANTGLQIIDLNQLPEKVSLVSADSIIGSAHNVYISNVDYTYNIALPNSEAHLQLVGQSQYGGSFLSASLSDPQEISSVFAQTFATRSRYTHDAASMQLDDDRATNDCVNAVGACSVLADFNETEFKLWDISDADNSTELSSTTYAEAEYVHSGWFTEDKRYVFVHDELDEQRLGINTTVRIYNVDSLTSPLYSGAWVGPDKTIDHNGFVRGNRYYMSNYQRGVTVLDISDPANPTKVGNFDTFPSQNSANFSGAWGVYPYLPSGAILVSDINSGLYIIKDNTRTSANGQLSFTNAVESTEQDTTLTLTVERSNGSTGAVSVEYETLYGSAGEEDVSAPKGELNWAAGDMTAKQVTFTIAADATAEELEELFFARLFNPQGGAVLGDNHYAQINVAGQVNMGSVNLPDSTISVNENDGQVTIDVNRFGSSSGEVSVDYQVNTGSADVVTDYLDASGTLTWADNDSASKTITIDIVDDDTVEPTETFSVSITSATDNLIGEYSAVSVSINDDDNNQLPTADAGLDISGNSRAIITLRGVGSDSDGSITSYAWAQTAGDTVTLADADTQDATFTAPSNAAEMTFELTVTDNFGATATDEVKVTISAPTPAPATPAQSSGGGGGGSLPTGILLFIPLLILRRMSKP